MLFAHGTLPDVSSLVSASGDGIYSDSFGHADSILVELGSLVWLNAIYGIDLTTYAYDPGTTIDLKGIAHAIMAVHDFTFGGVASVPVLPASGAALLATLLLGCGAWSSRFRARRRG